MLNEDVYETEEGWFVNPKFFRDGDSGPVFETKQEAQQYAEEFDLQFYFDQFGDETSDR